jgi:hypothetical protein
VLAEMTARELGHVSLEEALQLLLQYAAHGPAKFERAAIRWLSRYLDEGKNVSLLKAHLALAALADLRSGGRDAAAKLLSALARSL